MVKPKILVDTSFLLPALGVEVEDEAMSVIPLFRRLEVYYLEAGLLEAMWKMLRLIPPSKYNRLKLGLEAIRETYHLLTPPAKAYIEAIEIYRKGHRDYIDALHYATAKAERISFLTIDYRFLEFLESCGYEVEGIVVTPRGLKELSAGNPRSDYSFKKL